jgi:hypothetical protein
MKIKYPKIVHFGEEVTDFFKQGNLHIEEKIDGSQFRIWVDNGKVECGSKSIDWSEERPIDQMFLKAVNVAEKIFNNSKLTDTMIFSEFLAKPKHNTMKYERVPENNIIVFDVMQNGRFLPYDEKVNFANSFGLEAVPRLWEGDGRKLNMEIINKLLERMSILGKENVEGLVFKNYNKIWDSGYQAGKLIMLKYVREEFKERNKTEWKGNTKKGLIDVIIEELKTEARWNKAIQHLKEKGELTNSPKDIGNLMKEIADDLETEEGEQIKERLLKFFFREIRVGVVKGFPEYYKTKILKEALDCQLRQP